MRIAIEGLIGVGKSTFIREGAEKFGLTPVFESVEDNPFLSRYYGNPERWAYTLQMHFLYDRYLKHLPNQILLDRSIYGDLCFAEIQRDNGYMDKSEFDLYRKHFQILTSNLPPLDLCIHLDVSVEMVVERIKKRGRGYESDIPVSYLMTLSEQLERLPSYLPKNTRYVRVPWGDMNESERADKISEIKFTKWS